jgi:KaiC/GvpD/RAD55 family RecA-like ATPase
MTVVFQPAKKSQARLRMAVTGPAGAGKTYTALRIAKGIGDKVALIDTEAGSASKYADLFPFATVTLTSFHPQNFIEAIKVAEAGDFDALVIDSLSHAWMGKDGVMEQVDNRKASSRSQFAAWKEPSAMHSSLVEAILHARIHVIATMRSKMEYAQTDGQVKRLGMAPVQREGMEYEFDVVLDMDTAHNGRVSKSRIASLADAVIAKPGEEFGKQLKGWLSEGVALAEPQFPQKSADDSRPVIAEHTYVRPTSPLDLLWQEALTSADPRLKFAVAGIKKNLKDRGYKNWQDFLEHHAPDEAVEVTVLLTQPAVVA